MEHALSTTSGPDRFGQLDRSFGHMIVVGYLTGFVIVFGLMLALLLTMAAGISDWAAVFAALAVAVQGGVMGSVVAVGPWTAHHSHDLYH
jgi:hypothetical protein